MWPFLRERRAAASSFRGLLPLDSTVEDLHTVLGLWRTWQGYYQSLIKSEARRLCRC